MAQDPTVPTYKQGILARKMHHDADGKKSECPLPGSGGVRRESSAWGPCPVLWAEKNEGLVFLS